MKKEWSTNSHCIFQTLKTVPKKTLRDAAEKFVEFVNNGPSPYHGEFFSLFFLGRLGGLEHLVELFIVCFPELLVCWFAISLTNTQLVIEIFEVLHVEMAEEILNTAYTMKSIRFGN